MKLSLTCCLLFASLAFAQREYGFDNRKSSGQPYLTPDETVKRMKVPEEFEVKLFAGEPQVVNPIAFTIDERGRVWVVECFEYPSRTPEGKMPRDRIVILEDTDGDGVCDQRTVFCEGKDFPERFDLASGIEVGYGGVFVGAAPHLWFIENVGDKPGKFEKLASGFGSMDTHEILNTFQWGPDGWLYGLHGIFTQSDVKLPEGPEIKMNAAVWRYHPTQKKFEIFAEGTSNPWGLDWRSSDQQWILCACVIPHLYHIVPGGNYIRQAGTSYNPYAFGQIKEICDHTFHKESGWAHAGLISLDVPHIPEKYRNSVIFGSIHGCSLKRNVLKPNGSSYTASRADDFLVSGDKNMRPINLRWGPNGDIYLIDWHDQNPCHQAAAGSWDYERGRVYRIHLKGQQPYKAIDLSINDPDKIATYSLSGNNPWLRRTAMRRLRELATKNSTPSQGIRLATDFFNDADPERKMRAELLVQSLNTYIMPQTYHTSDNPLPAAVVAARLRNMAERNYIGYEVNSFLRILEPHSTPVVRRELASLTMKKYSNPIAVTILHNLMLNPDDLNDPVIPHLTWYSYEIRSTSTDAVIKQELQWLQDNIEAPIVREFILPRFAQRLAVDGKPDHLALIVNALANEDLKVRQMILKGIAAALKDQIVTAPAEWKTIREALLKMNDPNVTASVNAISVSFRDPEAVKKAVETAGNRSAEGRIDAIRQLGVMKDPSTLAGLLAIATGDTSVTARVEAIRAVAAFNNDSIAKELLARFKDQSGEVKAEIVAVLSTRKTWARELLNALKEKTIDPMLVGDNVILRIQALKDAELNQLIETAWGKSRATPADLQKQIDAMRKELQSGPGSIAKGKVLFAEHCGKCHKFDGVGSDVGPALDGAARDIEYLLANVLDPNRVIGAPYFVRQAVTAEGQVVQGMLAAEDERTITIKIENGVLKKLTKADLDGPVKVLERSIMPEGLTAGMKPGDFRDLVRYVMAHPFPARASVNGTSASIPVSGLIPLPDAKDAKPVTVEIKLTANQAVTTKLLVGSSNAFEAFLDQQSIGKGAGTERKLNPDSESIEVAIPKGEHTLKLVLQTKWATKGVFLRLLDPQRVIAFQE